MADRREAAAENGAEEPTQLTWMREMYAQDRALTAFHARLGELNAGFAVAVAMQDELRKSLTHESKKLRAQRILYENNLEVGARLKADNDALKVKIDANSESTEALRKYVDRYTVEAKKEQRTLDDGFREQRERLAACAAKLAGLEAVMEKAELETFRRHLDVIHRALGEGGEGNQQQKSSSC